MANDIQLSNNPNMVKATANWLACIFSQALNVGKCENGYWMKRPAGAAMDFYYEAGWMTETLLFYNFDVQSDQLKDEHKLALEEFALTLIEYEDIRVDHIIGRASQTGTEGEDFPVFSCTDLLTMSVADPIARFPGNIPLSRMRACQVFNFLKGRLIDADPLNGADRLGQADGLILAYGKMDPLVDNPGENHPLNLSVTIQYSYPFEVPFSSEITTHDPPPGGGDGDPSDDDDTDQDDTDSDNTPDGGKSENEKFPVPFKEWVLDMDQEINVNWSEVPEEAFAKIYKTIYKEATQDLIRNAARRRLPITVGVAYGNLTDKSSKIKREVCILRGGFALGLDLFLKGKAGKKEIVEGLNVSQFMQEISKASLGLNIVAADKDINPPFKTDIDVTFDDFHVTFVIWIEGSVNSSAFGLGGGMVYLPWINRQDLGDYTGPIATTRGLHIGWSLGLGIGASATVGLMIVGGIVY